MRRLLGVLLLALCVAMPLSAIAQDVTSVPDACITIRAAGDSGVFVNLPNDTTPESIAHAKEAVAAGQPRILHWDPAHATEHRRAALRGVRTQPGKQRDEYPPASSAEGGAGSDVRLITSLDNSRSGQRLGAVMSPYCAGTPFILEP